MFVIALRDNLYEPTFVCDYCQEPIDYGAGANYTWPMSVDSCLTYEADTVHKNCQYAFQKSHSTMYFNAVTLQYLPIYLESTLSIDRDEAERRAERFGSL